ncbi:aromatic/alkene monooxygenase hydroxylase subunit beta [Nocardioides pocheonensis]|uniref:propane 2-monooxygenase n=1 Tax=Nocardioides pocheonensis TaxID=661485 RepID=A0A3N0GIF0_9ACTN|nr:aromatic/alkene monooxygenase hydroxylase subunit beta [Nocardioides pocheonensis]RNM12209.1 methane monooxygenase [Nocardioides pocheonensis]
MAVYTAPKRTTLSGNRTFTWVKPQGKRPTEYEDLTVGQQSTPAQYAFQGWPVRFDDGRDPYTADATVVRCSDWYAFRDPNQTMQRPYIAGMNESEKALERSFAGAHAAGLFAFADEGWVRTGLAQHYMTYPFVEYGLFLALCYAEREALSDTTTFPIVFEAADKLRHLQGVVYYSFELEEAFPWFDDSTFMTAWMTDPVWQGARKAVENIIALNDWMEIVVAINLCFDRLFGDLAKVEYFSRFAAANGDVVTPILIASAEADSARTDRWTAALIEHLLDDPKHGSHNRTLINGWVEKWNAYALEACNAFAPVFDQATAQAATFATALDDVMRKQATYLEGLGLRVPAAA